MKRRRLTERKVDRAIVALEALLTSELPEGPEWTGGSGSPRQLIEAALWDAVHPLRQLFVPAGPTHSEETR